MKNQNFEVIKKLKKLLFEKYNIHPVDLISKLTEIIYSYFFKKQIPILDFNDVLLLNNLELEKNLILDLVYTYMDANAPKELANFYTPDCLSKLVFKLCDVKNENITVYDPACGLSSLLSQFSNCDCYGQDLDSKSLAIANMNLELNSVNLNLECGDTLFNDKFEELKFDVIVSNPPYSLPIISDKIKNDARFNIVSKLPNKCDFMFLYHNIYHLKDNGVCVNIEFPGICYRGNAEKIAREYFVDNNFLDCIIITPPNLFLNTQISVVIVIFKKNKINNDVLFIDASEIEISKLNSKQVTLTSKSIEKITNTYLQRLEIKDFSKIISNDEIKQKDYNWSVSSYLEKEDKKEKIDINEINKQIEFHHNNYIKLAKEIDDFLKETFPENY